MNSIRARVVATAYRGAATLLTVQPDARYAPQLHVEHAGPPPALGEVVPVVVTDGWIIPEHKPTLRP